MKRGLSVFFISAISAFGVEPVDLVGNWTEPAGNRYVDVDSTGLYDLVVFNFPDGYPRFWVKWSDNGDDILDFYSTDEELVASGVLNIVDDHYQVVFDFPEAGYQEIWTKDNSISGSSGVDTDDDVPMLTEIRDQLAVLVGHAVEDDWNENDNMLDNHEVPAYLEDLIDIEGIWDFAESELEANLSQSLPFDENVDPNTTFPEIESAIQDFKDDFSIALGLDQGFAVNDPNAGMPNVSIDGDNDFLGAVSVDLSDGRFSNILAIFKVGFTAVCLWFIGWWAINRVSLQLAA